jgi:hypothetical protein
MKAPTWALMAVLMLAIGVMFWCIDVGPTSGWARLGLIVSVAVIVAIPHVPRSEQPGERAKSNRTLGNEEQLGAPARRE